MLELLPYQKLAVDAFLLKKRVLWHWDVGVGKTPPALKAIEESHAYPAIYFCPSILKRQILNESQRFTQLDAVVVDGMKAERQAILNEKHDLYICNYEMLMTCFEEFYKLNPQFIVCDETQKITHSTNKSYKRLMKLSPEYRLCMSGTPVNNELWEYWGIANFLYPGAFGQNFFQWRSLNCKVLPYFPKIIGYFSEDRIRKQFAAFTNRIRREEVMQLPPLQELRIEIKMDEEHRKIYNILKNNLVLEMKGMETITVPNLLVLILRLKILTNCPRVMDINLISSKEKSLDEILEIHSLEKVIVFFNYTKVLHKINEKFKVPYIDGSVSQKDRDEILCRFRENKDSKLLFMSEAGGTGLNITEATIVIHYELPFSFSRIDQRNGRIWRRNQTKVCKSYCLIMADSIDEKLEKLIQKKKRLCVEDLVKVLK